MDFLFSRYRNLTVLLVALFAQLLLVAYQVKSNEDVRLIRVWAVTAVTPAARVLEAARSRTVQLVESYAVLVNTREENERLRSELDRLKMENRFLKEELGTAERAELLSAFRARNPSRTIAARVIGTGAGPSSKVIFVDRGSGEGVRSGMAVITPDGIVGKVVAAYPTASRVLLVTDPNFAAGVVSEKTRVQGVLKGTGQPVCRVDYLQNEERIEIGEWFYTSGDDRIFPRGLPAGKVKSVGEGRTFKEVIVAPTGLERGLDEVLIVLEGVHQQIPLAGEPAPGIHLLPPPPAEEPAAAPATPGEGDQPAAAPQESQQRFVPGTEADRLREHYERVGEAQGHVYGHGLPGSKPPDFNLNPAQAAAKAKKAGRAAAEDAGQAPEAERPKPAVEKPKPEAPPSDP